MVAPENPPAPATTEGMRWKSALASLGQYLRPDAAHFPQRAAYLKADTGRSAAFKAYLDQQGRGPIVGIAWGSYGAKIGHHKSLDLKAWGDILRTPNVRFVDLQYGDTAQERAEASAALGVSIIHIPDLDLREDIDGAAALTAVCDLVISVSNTAVHLAAGLGVPTWVMVPRAAGNLWYWMWDTDRTPWYPSVRIFRQSRPGYWGDVLNDVKGRLEEYLAASA
jgi:ADP-heptose:LPS heptosyltransferase